MASSTPKPGPTLQYDSHQQSVPITEDLHVDAPPSYAEAQRQQSTSGSTTSPPSNIHTDVHSVESSRSSVSSITAGEDVPLQQLDLPRKMTTGYHSPQPMTAVKPSDKDDGEGFCFSSNGACCFSDHGACCFSDHGACCFSDHGGCCFSSKGGCCFSSNGGCCFSDDGCCCNATGGKPSEERLRYD